MPEICEIGTRAANLHSDDERLWPHSRIGKSISGNISHNGKKFINSSGIHQKTVALFLCLELSSATQFATPKIRDEWRIDVFVPKGY